MRSAAIAALALCLALALRAEAGVDEAAAKHTPWSGYWWPIGEGSLLGPLAKYDQATGSAAAQWEMANNPPGPSVPQWHGYCHAWAAAAVLDKEPKQAVSAAGGRISLSVGDQKGILSAAHSQDVSNSYGDRFGDGMGSDDYYDLAPDELWRLLRLYIKQQGVPLVLDIEAGDEVWNYPVYAYRIEYAPYGNSGLQLAQLSLWMADDEVPPDFVGTKPSHETYTFTFQVAGGSIVMGSARWVGNSQTAHPDFAWYPYVVVSSNPYVKYATVRQLVSGGQVGGPSPGGVSPGGASPAGSTNPPANPPPIIGDGPGSRPPTSVPPGAGGPGSVGGQPAIAGGPPTVPGGLPPSGLPGVPPGANPAWLNGGLPVSPAQLVDTIADRTSTFGLDVTVDRFDGGQYVFGEGFSVRGKADRDGYLYLLCIDSQGGLSLLPPVLGSETARVTAGQPFLVGPYPVPGVPGVARVKAVITGQRLALTGLIRGKGKTGQQIAPQPFRWCPSQQQQLRGTLVKYIQQQPAQGQVPASKPGKLFGSFAQDEVAFYVGPAQ